MPQDQQVTLEELQRYVIPRVEELTHGRQHPYLPRLREFDPQTVLAVFAP